jgi:hypothetical protein
LFSMTYRKKFQNLLGFMVLIFETYFCAALDNVSFGSIGGGYQLVKKRPT